MAPHLRSHDTMPQFSRIAAVTGANKGIGLAIVRNLALQYPSSAFNNGPLLIYLCARDKGRGEDAVKALESDAQLKKAKALVQDGGLTMVKYHGLDISKTKSVLDFAGFLEKQHPEGIDMVVNNAGIAMNGFGMYIRCFSPFALSSSSSSSSSSALLPTIYFTFKVIFTEIHDV